MKYIDECCLSKFRWDGFAELVAYKLRYNELQKLDNVLQNHFMNKIGCIPTSHELNDMLSEQNAEETLQLIGLDLKDVMEGN